MKEETKMSLIVTALLQGRTIDQWNHIKEFKTTRLGGFIYAIRDMGLNVESRDIKTGNSGKPPVEYFCTPQSIKEFLSHDKNKKYLTAINFKQVDTNRYVLK